jgi:hypothetical protein
MQAEQQVSATGEDIEMRDECTPATELWGNVSHEQVLAYHEAEREVPGIPSDVQLFASEIAVHATLVLQSPKPEMACVQEMTSVDVESSSLSTKTASSVSGVGISGIHPDTPGDTVADTREGEAAAPSEDALMKTASRVSELGTSGVHSDTLGSAVSEEKGEACTAPLVSETVMSDAVTPTQPPSAVDEDF